MQIDERIVIAFATGGIGYLLSGYFNNVTMQTRTRADLEIAHRNSLAAEQKQADEDGRQLRDELRKDLERVTRERDAALEKCRVLQSEKDVGEAHGHERGADDRGVAGG